MVSTIHILRICVGITSDNIPESSRRRSHGLSWGGVISFEEESGHGDGKEDQERELAVEDAELGDLRISMISGFSASRAQSRPTRRGRQSSTPGWNNDVRRTGWDTELETPGVARRYFFHCASSCPHPPVRKCFTSFSPIAFSSSAHISCKQIAPLPVEKRTLHYVPWGRTPGRHWPTDVPAHFSHWL